MRLLACLNVEYTVYTLSLPKLPLRRGKTPSCCIMVKRSDLFHHSRSCPGHSVNCDTTPANLLVCCWYSHKLPLVCARGVPAEHNFVLFGDYVLSCETNVKKGIMNDCGHFLETFSAGWYPCRKVVCDKFRGTKLVNYSMVLCVPSFLNKTAD